MTSRSAPPTAVRSAAVRPKQPQRPPPPPEPPPRWASSRRDHHSSCSHSGRCCSERTSSDEGGHYSGGPCSDGSWEDDSLCDSYIQSYGSCDSDRRQHQHRLERSWVHGLQSLRQRRRDGRKDSWEGASPGSKDGRNERDGEETTPSLPFGTSRGRRSSGSTSDSSDTATYLSKG